MNASEKVAWTELAVSLFAAAVVLGLYPWLGNAALGGFGFLGLLGITPFLMRGRGKQVVSDERDLEIHRKSTLFGLAMAWTLLILTLATVTMWHSYHGRDVSTGLLNVMIWVHFALCYAIKGAISLLQYRGSHRAA